MRIYSGAQAIDGARLKQPMDGCRKQGAITITLTRVGPRCVAITRRLCGRARRGLVVLM